MGEITENKVENRVRIEMDAKSRNESFARLAVAAFVSELDPLVSDVIDIKTAVSEAVTNAIIHGYEDSPGTVYIDLKLTDGVITVTIKDDGVGIDDISRAMEPLYTSKPEEERSGMGFTVMEAFMDSIIVRSEKGRGTEVIMTKKLSDV
ncbi:MAG: anti-sigma F factor [Clostridiales bacterium]|jgi:stage II sporulation protein AB (anti-sigma F factor)|nr:anti-sigma F factor [Clostridiales bacterium]